MMNEKIFTYLNNFALQNELFDTIIIFITDWLIWWMIFGAIVLLLLKKITPKQFLKIIFYPAIIWGIAKIIKYFYFSPRPFLELENAKLLIDHGANDSMPSGHSVLSSALATATYLYNKKIGILFFLGAILIGLSRIIVGVHWPLDVLAGFLLGTAGVLILNRYIK
ncbi:phosphatase PAP2 family protein [Patescibacteria group bacterium]|nr:phosphatase PAP2 family protein [Patescibacteria group bacterium]